MNTIRFLRHFKMFHVKHQKIEVHPPSLRQRSLFVYQCCRQFLQKIIPLADDSFVYPHPLSALFLPVFRFRFSARKTPHLFYKFFFRFLQESRIHSDFSILFCVSHARFFSQLLIERILEELGLNTFSQAIKHTKPLKLSLMMRQTFILKL